MKPAWRSHLLFATLTGIGAFVIVLYFNQQPGFTDAFYHYNAAARLASGEGLTDDYLWAYVGAPDALPAPSHLYWMPLTSIVAAAGMTVFGVTFAAAQISLALCLWGACGVTYHLGWRFGTARHAWLAGWMVLLGGFYMRFWGQTDTFAPYALVGSLALLFMGLGATQAQRRSLWCWALAGVCAGLGHLTRADGLLLLLVGWWVLLIQMWQMRKQKAAPMILLQGVIFTLAYGVTMAAWFVRNLNAVGSILPVGGTQAIWYTGYNDLFNYPADANPQTFFADGLDLLIASRLEAVSVTLQNFIVVECAIVLTPFVLLALWNRRREAFWRGVIWFALGIHIAMTFVFTFPGMRGGLFHAVTALLPFWMVLGLLGLDEIIEWVAKRRRRWRPQSAKWVFSLGVLGLVLFLSLSTALPRRTLAGTPPRYPILTQTLDADARVMVNDTAMLYYYTGLGGVPLPNEDVTIIPTIANVYAVDYLVVERSMNDIPPPMRFDLDNPPPFLTEITLPPTDIRLYRIDR